MALSERYFHRESFGHIFQLAVGHERPGGPRSMRCLKRTKSGRAPGKQLIAGKNWRLAKEVDYIQRRATAHDGRFVSVGPLVLFSTDTGDAWLLDPSDRLAAPLARDGILSRFHIEKTDTNFAIGWTEHYRINGAAFIYTDYTSGRVLIILGYPTDQIAKTALR
jgi:hypothetical protein